MSARVVACPTCKRPVTWGEQSPFRPFCSDRCRLIDLGAWFAEEHSIPGQEPSALDEPSDDENQRR